MKLLSFIKKFFFLINIIFGLYSLLVFQLVYSVDIKHWIGGFIMLTFPLVILGNLFFIICWVFGGSYKVWLSIIILLVGYGFSNRTVKLFPNEAKWTPNSFSLLSYNLMYGDFHNYKTKKNTEDAIGIIKSLETLSGDIKCFQELYNTDEYEDFKLLKKISNRNQYYVYMHSNPNNNNGQGAIGLAIFSRFPIIHKNEIYWPPNNNGMLSADIVINNDTIRVINIQLKSMGIRVQKIINSNKQIDEEETKNVFLKLKDGFNARIIQVNILENWINESPHPVIVVGDLNELPYGYAYGRIRKKLSNAFENSGFGFGFTYHKILSFLRIDNEFYDSKRIENIDFQTISNIPYSDHYPIKGIYVIKNKHKF